MCSGRIRVQGDKIPRQRLSSAQIYQIQGDRCHNFGDSRGGAVDNRPQGAKTVLNAI